MLYPKLSALVTHIKQNPAPALTSKSLTAPQLPNPSPETKTQAMEQLMRGGHVRRIRLELIHDGEDDQAPAVAPEERPLPALVLVLLAGPDAPQPARGLVVPRPLAVRAAPRGAAAQEAGRGRCGGGGRRRGGA